MYYYWFSYLSILKAIDISSTFNSSNITDAYKWMCHQLWNNNIIRYVLFWNEAFCIITFISGLLKELFGRKVQDGTTRIRFLTNWEWASKINFSYKDVL